MEAQKALVAALGSVDLRANPDVKDAKEFVAPVLDLMRKSAGSDGFRAFADSHSVKAVQLPRLLASYCSSRFQWAQMRPYYAYMEAFVKTRLARHFRVEEMLDAHVCSSIEQARLFALRAAMHRAYPSLAEEGASSCRSIPVFYYTIGSKIAGDTDSLAWQLFQPPKCFKSIPITAVAERPNPAGGDRKRGAGERTSAAAAANGTAAKDDSRSRSSTAASASASTDTDTDTDTNTNTTTATATAPIGDVRGNPNAHSSSGPEGEEPRFLCYEMSLAALEAQIADDKASGRLPCAIYATVGASEGSQNYQCDDVLALRRICDKHSIALVVEGTCLLLCGTRLAGRWFQTPFNCADAVIADPLEWIAPPAGHSIGLCMARQSLLATTHTQQHPNAINPNHTTTSLFTYPDLYTNHETVQPLHVLWQAFLTTSLTSVTDHIETHLRLCSHLRSALEKEARWLNAEIGPGSRKPHIVIFRIRPAMGLRLEEFNLNQNGLQEWLYSQLTQAGHRRHFSIVQINEAKGIFFQPFSQPAPQPEIKTGTFTVDDIDAIVARMKILMTSLMLAGRTRSSLRETIGAKFPNLEFVPPRSVQGCVEAGAVRYVPPFRVPSHVVDSLNKTLACLLEGKHPQRFALAYCSSASSSSSASSTAATSTATADGTATAATTIPSAATAPAPSPGTSVADPGASAVLMTDEQKKTNGHRQQPQDHHRLIRRKKSRSQSGSALLSPCIVLKAATAAGDSEAMLQTIVDVAASMELPKDVMDALSESIAKGIQEAERKIENHTATAYHPISLVRKTPIIGTVLGWVFPAEEKNSNNVGHTYDISSGVEQKGRTGQGATTAVAAETKGSTAAIAPEAAPEAGPDPAPEGEAKSPDAPGMAAVSPPADSTEPKKDTAPAIVGSPTETADGGTEE